MEKKFETGPNPLYEELLKDPDGMLTIYDQAAQEMVEIARSDGHFEGWDPDELIWPPSRNEQGPIGLPGLLKRAKLIRTIFDRVPALREKRLSESHAQFQRACPAYHEANLIYIQVQQQFVDRGIGTEGDLLQLYQSLYVDVLAKEDLLVPDAGEAALERAKISRVPMSHAQGVAEALPAVAVSEDPRWEDNYTYAFEGHTTEAPLLDLLRKVVKSTLDYISAGEFLATRYNAYTNFAWFGSSVWKVITEADLLRYRLYELGDCGLDRSAAESLKGEINRAQGMMVEFLGAHRENPAQLKPAGYWYGHHYSYLTRDMTDTAMRLAAHVNRDILRVKDSVRAGVEGLHPVSVPPLLSDQVSGRFLEYRHVGRSSVLSSWSRGLRLGRWVVASFRLGRRKINLTKADLDPDKRSELAWQYCLDWAEATLRTFGIRVKIQIDPKFLPIAQGLELGSGKKKILMLPTHQSYLDHPVMYHVLGSPEFLGAMGWKRPVPFVILARTGLANAGVKIGSWSMTMFGMSAERFDGLLADVDGYVTLERSRDAIPTTQRLVQALGERPGLTYPAGTIAAFGLQSPPLQHALFALLPHDVVVIPLAFRGIHSCWPKCPKGNLHINPGLVEVVVSPPMPGETTLLPRRRSLRTQVESASLFQAVHITSLLNPEPSGP